MKRMKMKFIPTPTNEHTGVPNGALIVPECQIAPVMESLAKGIAPDVFDRTPLDAVNVLGPIELSRIAKIQHLNEVEGSLVAEEDGWLVWRPDPEFNFNPGSYRHSRFLRARSLGEMSYPGGVWEWAEIQWDSGHGNVSSFFSRLLRFGVAFEKEEATATPT